MNKGFTLLELLVVVMILGILTSVAMPQYSRSVRRAEMMEGMSHGKTIYDSALRYKSVNGEVPKEFNKLDVGFAGSNINGGQFLDGNFSYTLLSDGVEVKSQLESYKLLMKYPVVSSTGVTAPVYCCPTDTGNKNAVWLCQNASGTKTAVNGCYEIK